MTETTVLVDARNVLRSQWPNIPERELVELTCEWAERKGVRAVVVFDGRAPDVPESGHCTIVGTEGESADEWLTRRAEQLRADGVPFWLVTSDRALRAAAEAGAERTIGGGTFANELRPLPRGRRSKRVDRSIQTEPRANHDGVTGKARDPSKRQRKRSRSAPPDGGTASGAAAQ